MGGAALWFDGIYLDRPLDELKPLYTNSESKFIEIDGMQVHYRDQGQGPTLVVLHGVNSSLHTWEDWVHNLNRDFRIISLDLPGYGLTGPDPQARYRPIDTANFLDHFTDALDLDPFHLAGNSRGGAVAWTFAALYPDKVKRLVLLDSAGLPRDEPRTPLLRIQTIPVVKEFISVVTPKWITAIGVKQVYGDVSLVTDELVDAYHYLMLREGNRVAGSQALAQLYSDYEVIEKLKTLPHKTLILWGDQDNWIAPKYGIRLADMIPNSQRITYSGVGHIPMEEIPEQTANDVRKFLLAQ